MNTLDDLIDKLAADLPAYDRAIGKRRLKVVSDGQTISCDGCETPGCCSLYILITPNDAFVIARRLKRDGRDTAYLRTRLRENGEKMASMTVGAWFDTSTPCVFLSDRRCTVYEERPTPCRACLVTSPRENCQPPSKKGTWNVNTGEVIAGSLMQAIQLAGMSGAADPSKPPLLPLPLMVLRCLEGMEMEDEDSMWKHIYGGMWTKDELFKNTEGRDETARVR
jgi:Fe-S-cluster containining protein